MSAPPRRRLWLRRLSISLAVVAGLLAIAVAGVWLSLPWLVRKGFASAAGSIGSDEASIRVVHADFSGMRMQAVNVQLGGAALRLGDAELTYSLGTLLDGRMSRVAIDDLEVALDFTRPRRGLLPDAVADLLERFGGGGELSWPVDTLTLTNCRVTLGLPDGPHTVTVAGSATRRPDGMIAFELKASDPEQHATIRGAVRTATMEGEISIDRLSLHPDSLLGIASQLNLAAMPEGVSFEAARIELSGTAELKDGVAESFACRVQSPSARLTHLAERIAIDGLDLEVRQTTGGARTATLTADISASDSDTGWKVERSPLHLALSAGRVHGSLDSVHFAFGDTASGRISLSIESGVPFLGGQPQGKAVLAIEALRVGPLDLAPAEVSVEGWTDRLAITMPRLALAADSPIELTELNATILDPAGAGRTVDGSVVIRATPTILSLLPKGWSLPAPTLPAQAARIAFTMSEGSDGPVAAIGLHSHISHVHLAHESLEAEGAPVLELTLQADTSGASLTGGLQIGKLRTIAPSALPQTDSLSVSVDLPHTSYGAISALAGLRSPEEECSVTFGVEVGKSTPLASASLVITNDVRNRGWTAGAEATIHEFTAPLAGVSLEGVNGRLSCASGLLNDTSIAAWLNSGDMSALCEVLLRQMTLDLTLNASSIDLPGAARLEWAGLALNKPPGAAGQTPKLGSLKLSAGTLRAGPETIVQPSVAVDLSGSPDALTATATVRGLLDGAPVSLDARQDLRIDSTASAIRAEGTFELQPVSLAHSDIAARWAAAMKGVAVSGTIAAHGTTSFASGRGWDGTANISVSDGVFNNPAQELRAEGIFATLGIESLATLRMASGQEIGLAHLKVSDIVVSDALVRFRAEDASVVHVESAGFHVFDGTITAEPFSLYFPDPDVALDLRMKDLDAGVLVRTFDLFNGSLTGRLQGRLPIGLLAGKPIIGEGFLELQPEHPARLSFDAGGLFTSGLPNRTVLEQINRLPHELLEAGLSNLQLRHFRIDLFRRDQPDRPIDIALGGIAHTPRADVPIELVVHLNGSMSEVIDMLLQLIML